MQNIAGVIILRYTGNPRRYITYILLSSLFGMQKSTGSTRLDHKSLLGGVLETTNECIVQKSKFYTLNGSKTSLWREIFSENHSALRRTLHKV